MMLLIPLLIIILGLLIRTGIIKNLGNAKNDSTDFRNSSNAVIAIGTVLALLEIYPQLNLSISLSARLIVDICLFALLLIVPIYFIAKHAQRKIYNAVMIKVCALYTIFFCFMLLFVYSIREPSIRVNNEKLYIGSVFSKEVELKDIDSVWITGNKLTIQKKLSGFDFINHYRGKFKIKGSEDIHWLYVDLDRKTVMYIKLKNSTFIVISRSETNTLSSLQWTLKTKLKKLRL